MKPGSLRTLSMLISLLILSAAMWFYLNVARDEFSQIQKLRGDLAGQQQVLTEQQTAVKQVKDLISKSKSNPELANSLNFILPTSPDIAGAVAQINYLAGMSHVTPQSLGVSISPIQTNTNGGLSQSIGSVTYQIRVGGDYASIKAFLHYLETNIRIMDLDQMTINPTQSTGQFLDFYMMDAVVRAYYQPAYKMGSAAPKGNSDNKTQN